MSLSIGRLQLAACAELFIDKSQVIHVMKAEGRVHGIARLDTELFVCTLDSRERVAVYDLNTYSVAPLVTVSDLKWP